MPEVAFKRADRVSQLIQQELGQLLVNGVKDPRIGFCTVTEVRLSDDLKSARVYVSIYGTDEQRQQTLDGLKGAAGYLKREIGKKIRLRYTPNLSFAADTTLDHAERIDTLIASIADGDTVKAPDRPEALPVETTRSELDATRDVLDQLAQATPPPKPAKVKARAKRTRKNRGRR